MAESVAASARTHSRESRAPARGAQPPEVYAARNKIRIVTAASLFDGHDAAINVMRRILQASGAEVIHLGHDRSVDEVVACAIQEDVNAIAMTSYQGGHVEYLHYMHDRLKEERCGHIRIFAGGGYEEIPVADLYHDAERNQRSIDEALAALEARTAESKAQAR